MLAVILLSCPHVCTLAWHRGINFHAEGHAVSSMSSARRPTSRCAIGCMAPRPNRGRGRWNQPPVVDTTPINDAITFETMRVMVDAGGGADEMLGVMGRTEALAEAAERELDLVLISEKSDPPVVKIVSYDKFRFAKEKKRKEQQKAAARGKSELKELKMSYKIGEHDYGVRRKQAIKFLSSGDKVKFSMLFKGREVTHADVGREIMERMAGELDEFGVLDSPPKVMGRQMIMMVSPRARAS